MPGKFCIHSVPLPAAYLYSFTDFLKNPFHLIQGQFIQVVKTALSPTGWGSVSLPVCTTGLSIQRCIQKPTSPAQSCPGGASYLQKPCPWSRGPCRKADAGRGLYPCLTPPHSPFFNFSKIRRQSIFNHIVNISFFFPAPLLLSSSPFSTKNQHPK